MCLLLLGLFAALCCLVGRLLLIGLCCRLLLLWMFGRRLLFLLGSFCLLFGSDGGWISCGIRIGGLLLRFGIEGGLGGGGGGRVAFLRWSLALVLDGINERLHEL